MYDEIFAGNDLRVIGRSVQCRETIVTFDYYAPGKRDFQAFEPATWLCGNEFCEIRLQTRVNDWFLNDELHNAISSMAQELSSQNVVICVGFSMGAFGALLAGSLLGANYIVAVSPQFFPLVINEEKELVHTISMKEDLRSLLPAHKRRCRGALLFDPDINRDRFHARKIKSAFPNLDYVPLPGSGHPATKRLRELRRLGLLKKLIKDHPAGLKALREIGLN